MIDVTIGDLPKADSINDEDLIEVESQQGSMKVTVAQIKEEARAAGEKTLRAEEDIQPLPTVEERANKIMGFDDQGNPIAVEDNDSGVSEEVVDQKIGQGVSQGINSHNNDAEAHPGLREYTDQSISSHNSDAEAHPELKSYVDQKVSQDIDQGISDHNADADAHPELRASIVSEASVHVTAEADRAEAASNAAFVNADVYPDVATGLAAVADGEQFQVFWSDEIIRYRRDNSSTYTEVARYPSAASIFKFRGVLPVGGAVASATETGVYQGDSSGGYSDLPDGFPASQAFYVLVYPASGNSGGNRFKHQELRQFNWPGECWVRRLDTNNPTVAQWHYTQSIKDNTITNPKILNGAVSHDKLSQAFSFGGILNSGSANSVAKTGGYLVVSAMDDMPPDAPAQGYLDVQNYSNGSWVLQRFTALQEPDLIWQRVIRIGAGVFNPWVSLKAATGGTPFAGKKMVFLGDSITQNGDYPARVAARLGAETYNFGIGGTRLAQGSSNYDALCGYKLSEAIGSGDWSGVIAGAQLLFDNTGADHRAMVEQMSELDWSGVDYIVLFYGTNDWNGRIPLGTDGDTTGATFRGAMNKVVSDILGVHPAIRLLFVSPMWRSRNASGDGLESDTNPNPDGVYLIEYADAMVEIANLNHVPSLDMYRKSGVNKYTGETYLLDGLHPRAPEGYQLVADKISAALMTSY